MVPAGTLGGLQLTTIVPAQPFTEVSVNAMEPVPLMGIVTLLAVTVKLGVAPCAHAAEDPKTNAREAVRRTSPLRLCMTKILSRRNSESRTVRLDEISIS